jgi:hypothetical protein
MQCGVLSRVVAPEKLVAIVIGPPLAVLVISFAATWIIAGFRQPMKLCQRPRPESRRAFEEERLGNPMFTRPGELKRNACTS